ncbi:MAG: hypothetical protein ACI4J3_08540 [Oscillospiraceae bacterium]
MRRLFTLTLCVAFCFGCTGCISNPALSSVNEVESTAEESIVLIPTALPEYFNITIPAGFTATSSAAYEEYYICNDASIIITDDPIAISGERLDNYAAKVKEIYEQTADNYLLLNEAKETINGTEAVLLEFTYALVGEDKKQDLQAMVCIMLHHDVAYVITCKSKAKNFMQYRAGFREAINTIEIETPPVNTEGAVTRTGTQKTTTTTSETTTA